jgi:hypothetical protein
MPRRTPKFQAHAVALIERPSPLFIASVIGMASLMINFDRRLPSATWVRQAISKLSGVHPMYRVKGFVINFAPDMSVRFTLDGMPVETLDYAVPLPVASLNTIH